MFDNLSEPLLQRMASLEAIDAQDRRDGTPRLERLRQIPPLSAPRSLKRPPGPPLGIGRPLFCQAPETPH